MNQVPERVRVLSAGGNFVRTVTHEAAVRMVREGRATVRRATRNHLKSIASRDVKIGQRLPGCTQLHYHERLADTFSLITLKRAAGGGNFVNWDQGLTFAELRENPNKLVSEATKIARREARV